MRDRDLSQISSYWDEWVLERRKRDENLAQAITISCPCALMAILYPFMIDIPRILIGIGSSVVGSIIGTIIAQFWVSRRDRINRVVAEYFKLAEHIQRPHGLQSLLKSGVTELENNREFYKACKMIIKRGQPHPNALSEKLPNNQILPFLKWCQQHNKSIESLSDAAFEVAIWKR